MRKDSIKCCCIGQRAQAFASGYRDKTHIFHQKYLQTLEKAIESHVQNGIRHFVCGASSETALDFAEIVLKMRDKCPDLQLEIDLAFQYQHVIFSPANQLRYQKILRCADTLLYLFNHQDFCNKAQHDFYMVDNSLYVIAIWNGLQDSELYHTITYACEQGKQVEVIHLSNV